MTPLKRDLWPEDIKSDDAITPFELLEHQAELLERRTNGVLSGDVVRHETEDRIVLGFEVVADRINERQRLFEVQHRPEFEYPVAIVPPDDTLPDYLKSRRYVPSPREMVGVIAPAIGSVFAQKGDWVKNEWLATSPDEFVIKIETILQMPTVKAAVISLLSRAKRANNGGAEPRVGVSE
jgi:hypothetical protein